MKNNNTYELQRLLKIINKRNRFLFFMVNKNNFIFDCYNVSLYILPMNFFIETNHLYFNGENILEATIFLSMLLERKIRCNSIINNYHSTYCNKLFLKLNEDEVTSIIIEQYGKNLNIFDNSKINQLKPYFFIIFNKLINKTNKCNKYDSCPFFFLCNSDYLKNESCEQLEHIFTIIIKTIANLSIHVTKQNQKQLFDKIKKDINLTMD